MKIINLKTMYGTYPSSKFAAVTKSDTVQVTYTEAAVTGDPKSPLVLNRFRGIYVGGSGDLILKSDNGVAVPFQNVAAGSYFPFSGSYVMAATTATLMVATF